MFSVMSKVSGRSAIRRSAAVEILTAEAERFFPVTLWRDIRTSSMLADKRKTLNTPLSRPCWSYQPEGVLVIHSPSEKSVGILSDIRCRSMLISRTSTSISSPLVSFSPIMPLTAPGISLRCRRPSTHPKSMKAP